MHISTYLHGLITLHAEQQHLPCAGSCPAAETACSTTLLLLCILPTLPALYFLHFWEKSNDCDLRISYFARKIRRAPCYSPFLSVRKTALKYSSGLNQALHTSQARGIRTTWGGKGKTNKPAVQTFGQKSTSWNLATPTATVHKFRKVARIIESL